MSDAKHYQILELVATGGTAVLYRAIQTSLDRVVAVKKLHHHLTTDENFTRRFILEAKAAASLDHENIVKIIDFGVDDGTYMMVMEFIEGESFRDILDKWKQLPVNLALAVCHQICTGLEHAHAKGIIHRDIKPGNVMLTRMGRVKITDFGLAKLAQGQVQQTAANSILGTPLYMSPEQAFGETVDQRSDLFSLGTVLYETLTGHQPFEGDNYMGVIQNIIHQNAPKPSGFGIDLDPGVEAILLKSMHKNRDSRFQSAREFRQAIEKHMGLDALNDAAENLKSLLAPDGATMLLPRTERARNKKRRLKRSFAVAFTVGALAGIAALVYVSAPLTTRERIAETLARSGKKSAAPSSAGETGFFSAGATDGFTPLGVPADESISSAVPANQAVPDDSATVAPATTNDSTAAAGEAARAPAANTLPEAPAADARQTEDSQAPKKTEPVADSGEAEEVEKTGWLSVTSEPAADIYIDDRFIGDTPRRRVEILSGRHTLKCLSPNHESYVEDINISAGELSSRSIIMTKLVGRISLSTIEGAEVYLDGVFVGPTPLKDSIEVEAGRHQLTVKKAGYHVWNNSVAIDARQVLTLKITLSTIY